MKRRLRCHSSFSLALAVGTDSCSIIERRLDKAAEADTLTYYNAKVAQNYQVETKLKELETAKIRAEKWNGVEVSSQSVYVPSTYGLKTGVQ